METASDILRALGGPVAVSRACTIPPATVIHWGRRGSIPSKHWPVIIGLATVKKVPGINPDTLLRANEASR